MSKKLKVGLIGTGAIAHMCHLPGYAALPDDCEMVVACDIIEQKAKDAAKEYNIPKVVTDYRDVLNDPEVEAVSVLTPNAGHMHITIDALKAGKHVLCEKPLAMNGDEARKMVRAAHESGKMLQVALQSRFGSSGQFMRDYIATGAMGNIQYARAQALRRRGVPGWGVFIDKEKQGGGPLIDIGVHILDLTLYFMGYPKPLTATGMTWNTLGTDPKIKNLWGDYDHSKFTVEDFAVGMIRFEGGQVVTLESSFMANMEGDPFQTQLFGTKSGAIVKASGENAVRIYTEREGQYFEMIPQALPNVPSAHHAEVKAFVEAVRSGAPSPVPGECGLILNAIFDAIYKSSESGHEEKVDVSF